MNIKQIINCKISIKFILCYIFLYKNNHYIIIRNQQIIIITPILQKSSQIKMYESSVQGKYYQPVAIIIIIFNCISMISLSFVIGVYVKNWKKIASFPMRLSFYLCCACLGQNIYVILLNPITIHNIQSNNGPHTSGYCIFQGILKVTFDLSSILWTTIIIYSTYASIVFKINLESKEILFLIICFLVPLIFACIPTAWNLYGYIQYYCWFSTGYFWEQFWLKMGFFFIPFWVLFFVNLGLSIKTYITLRKIQLQKKLLVIFQRLMLFPFIMFITGFFATIDLIYMQATRSYLPWLDVLGLLLLSLYGFFTSLAYGFNPLIRQKIQICLKGKQLASSVGDDSRIQQQSNSSRNTQKIQAQLYQYRTISRKPTQPILSSLKKK